MAKLLLILAILFMVLTGGCTLAFIASGASAGAFVVGGIPFLLALNLFFYAKKRTKNR